MRVSLDFERDVSMSAIGGSRRLGNDVAVVARHNAAGRRQAIDAAERIAGMDENLFILVEPAVDFVLVETAVGRQVGRAGNRSVAMPQDIVKGARGDHERRGGGPVARPENVPSDVRQENAMDRDMIGCDQDQLLISTATTATQSPCLTKPGKCRAAKIPARRAVRQIGSSPVRPTG